jgi:tRNA-2-methylthio-N6-dimethylallyladenosine synthase
MLGHLSKKEIHEVKSPEDADIIIINTCSVREKPEEKTYSEIGRYKRLKDENERLILAVSGCVAQQRGAEIIERFPFVDLVLGTHNIDRISDLIDEIREKSTRPVETDFSDNPTILPFPRTNGSCTAYVTIMQGCNNFCSYCIVPYVRGREISRPKDDIIDEVRFLAEGGVLEVTLLGQNVNSYRDVEKNADFCDILREVAEIDGISRIRFTTSHPKDLTEGLISCYGEIEKLCPHIHLPLQSGSDRVLKRMNRNYTSSDYIEKVDALRTKRTDLGITTDIIVGFPGESVADFEATLSVMERVMYDGAYSFKYSPRPGTLASTFSDDVPDDEKRRRLSVLQELQRRHTRIKNNENIDQVEEVLATGPSLKDPTELTGRSEQNKVVNFCGEMNSIGSLVSVRITRALNNSLWGEAIN